VESAEFGEAGYRVFAQLAGPEAVSKLSMEVLDGAEGAPDGLLRKTLIKDRPTVDVSDADIIGRWKVAKLVDRRL